MLLLWLQQLAATFFFFRIWGAFSGGQLRSVAEELPGSPSSWCWCWWWDRRQEVWDQNKDSGIPCEEKAISDGTQLYYWHVAASMPPCLWAEGLRMGYCGSWLINGRPCCGSVSPKANIKILHVFSFFPFHCCPTSVEPPKDQGLHHNHF